MASNDLVLLDQILKERQAARETPLPDDQAFELLGCELVMAHADLGQDEIEQGIVGGGNDGGIDGIYVLLGDHLLTEDSDVFDRSFTPSSVEKGVSLALWLVQAKTESGFTETAIDLAASSTKRLLDLEVDDNDLKKLYSAAVVERTGLFREALRKLATRYPEVTVRFVYVTRGDTSGVDAKVEIKRLDLAVQFESMLSCGASVELYGASELYARASRSPSYTLELTYQENATSGSSHIALVSLRDYMTFISDESGSLRRHIFDWNVRDYQGWVEVNREIATSLENVDAPEFWWLNNGVTVICSKTSIVGKTYILEDVQIVNGLQTSHTIYRTLQSLPQDSETLSKQVMVRILVTADPTTRDQVIRATNRQTSVPVSSLRATDVVQRQIEQYFLSDGWYYDRRKNHYRNIGKNVDKIVSIPYLAQAVMAMGLGRPNDSRGRPSSLLKQDDDYTKVFSSKIDLAVYLWCAVAQKEVDLFLQGAVNDAQERLNARFYVSMLAAREVVGTKVYSPAQLAATAKAGISITVADLAGCLAKVKAAIASEVAKTGTTDDKLAKSRALVDAIG